MQPSAVPSSVFVCVVLTFFVIRGIKTTAPPRMTRTTTTYAAYSYSFPQPTVVAAKSPSLSRSGNSLEWVCLCASHPRIGKGYARADSHIHTHTHIICFRPCSARSECMHASATSSAKSIRRSYHRTALSLVHTNATNAGGGAATSAAEAERTHLCVRRILIGGCYGLSLSLRQPACMYVHVHVHIYVCEGRRPTCSSARFD